MASADLVSWLAMSLLRRSLATTSRGAAASTAVLFLFLLLPGCQSAAAHYELHARAIGQFAAQETRSYIEQDATLLDRPGDRSRSLEQVESLERMTAEADVSRLHAIERAWADVGPMFKAYVRNDSAISSDRKQALLTIAATFDRLNRAEHGRQAGWLRVQGMRRRLEPN